MGSCKALGRTEDERDEDDEPFVGLEEADCPWGCAGRS